MAKAIVNLKEQLSELRRKALLEQVIDCSKEDNKKYMEAEKNGLPLPEGVYAYKNLNGDKTGQFYTLHTPTELSQDEKTEYIMLKQLSYTRTIKNCVVFFVVLAVLSLVVMLTSCTNNAYEQDIAQTDTDTEISEVEEASAQQQNKADADIPTLESALSGGDVCLDRKFKDALSDIGIMSDIVGAEAVDEWVNNVYLLQTKEHMNLLPDIYQAIKYFGVTKEQFEKANKHLSSELVDALFCGDETQMIRLVKNSNALYCNGEIYTIDSISKEPAPNVSKEVMSEFILFAKAVFEQQGTLRYEAENLDRARILNGLPCDLQVQEANALVGFKKADTIELYDEKGEQLVLSVPKRLTDGLYALDSIDEGTWLDADFYCGTTQGLTWSFAVSKPAFHSCIVNLCVSQNKSVDNTYYYDIARGGAVTGAVFVTSEEGFISLKPPTDKGFDIRHTRDRGKTWSSVEVEKPKGFSDTSVILPAVTPSGVYNGLYPFVLEANGEKSNIWLLLSDGGEWQWIYQTDLSDNHSDNALSDNNEEQVLDVMPPPFEFEGYSTGNIENSMYYQLCEEWLLDGVSASLVDLVDKEDYAKWVSRIKNTGKISCGLTDYVNTYSFIKEFGVSDEEVISALSPLRSPEEPVQNGISKEELDVILSGNEEAIAELCKTNYAIVVGTSIYSPEWMYRNTTDAYTNAGITPEMVLQKTPYYSHIGFSDEAVQAFEKKLSEFTGTAVKLRTRVGIDVDGKFYSAVWLSSHTIQDYAANGITLSMVEAFLEEAKMYLSQHEIDTPISQGQYEYVESAYTRMKDDVQK